MIDNVTRKLGQVSLAALLTARTWRDRLLGKSKTVEVPNRTLWIVTGNNVAMNDEWRAGPCVSGSTRASKSRGIAKALGMTPFSNGQTNIAVNSSGRLLFLWPTGLPEERSRSRSARWEVSRYGQGSSAGCCAMRGSKASFRVDNGCTARRIVTQLLGRRSSRPGGGSTGIVR